MGKDEEKKNLNNNVVGGNTGDFSTPNPTAMLSKLKQIKSEQKEAVKNQPKPKTLSKEEQEKAQAQAAKEAMRRQALSDTYKDLNESESVSKAPRERVIPKVKESVKFNKPIDPIDTNTDSMFSQLKKVQSTKPKTQAPKEQPKKSTPQRYSREDDPFYDYDARKVQSNFPGFGKNKYQDIDRANPIEAKEYRLEAKRQEKLAQKEAKKRQKEQAKSAKNVEVPKGDAPTSVFDRLKQLQEAKIKNEQKQAPKAQQQSSSYVDLSSLKKTSNKNIQRVEREDLSDLFEEEEKPKKVEPRYIPRGEEKKQKKINPILASRRQDAATLFKELKQLQKERDKQREIDKAKGKVYANEEFDVNDVLDRAKKLRIENGTEQEYLELIEAEKRAKREAQKAAAARQARIEAEREMRARRAIAEKERELDRPLTEEEIAELRNRLLLEEAAENEAHEKKKKRILFIIIFILCILFALAMAAGVWMFYDNVINIPTDGTVRVSIKIDDSTWYDYDIDEGAFKDKVVEPGDTIYPNIVVRNSYQVEGDGLGSWDYIFVRFRAYMTVDGKLLPKALIVDPANSVSEKWFVYDKSVEDNLTDLSGNPIITTGDGWFYLGGLLAPNQAVSLVNSITFDGEYVGNEVANKQCNIVIEVQAMSYRYANYVMDRESILSNGDLTYIPQDQADPNLYWVKAPEAWVRYMKEYIEEFESMMQNSTQSNSQALTINKKFKIVL